MITQTQCTIFKQNLLNGLENFSAATPYIYKIALYNANAQLDNTTTLYTTTNEVVGTGYVAGGQILTIIPPTSDTQNNTAYLSFNDAIWTPANFTCRGALIYNATTGAAIAVLNFGADKNAINSFTVAFPAVGSTTAIIRIA